MKNTRSAKIVEKPAGEIVMQLAAMANFPGERAAVEALARALERSACDSGMTMQAIVDECLNGGAFCPTPFDLRNLAMGMKKLAREKRFGVKAATAGEIAEVLEQQKRNRERAKTA